MGTVAVVLTQGVPCEWLVQWDFAGRTGSYPATLKAEGSDLHAVALLDLNPCRRPLAALVLHPGAVETLTRPSFVGTR